MKNFREVISLLSMEIKKYTTPIVTKIGDSNDPFKVLVSCMLSLRTRDATTAKAVTRLFKIADTPKRILKLGNRKLEKLIYPVGFYKVKAKRIKNVSKVLIQKYHSKVPSTMDELLRLEGIGRKCAGLILRYGYNKTESIPTDIHVHRISNRIGWVKTSTPEKTEQELMKIVPKKYWGNLNNTLVAFGQNTCLPLKPKCYACPVVAYCEYEYKTLNK